MPPVEVKDVEPSAQVAVAVPFNAPTFTDAGDAFGPVEGVKTVSGNGAEVMVLGAAGYCVVSKLAVVGVASTAVKVT
jgi:hypothetical protein